MNNGKSLISVIPFVGVLTLGASPLVTIGDFADISFTGSAALTSDSNIFRISDNEVSDTIFTLSPGFSANLGKSSSALDIQMATKLDIKDFQDRSELDTELFHFNTDIGYRGTRLSSGLLASFDESKSNTADANLVGGLTERELVKVKLNNEYKYSPKLSFGLGYQYRNTKYVGSSSSFRDLTHRDIPFKAYYELTPKVDLSLGYTRGKVDVEGDNQGGDSDTDYYNIGLRGTILPKLNGSFDLGLTDRDGALSNSTTMGANLSLSWLITPKFITALALDRAYSASVSGENVLNTNANLTFTYTVNNKLTVSPSFIYGIRKYDSGRKDDLFVVALNANYTINTNLSINGNYTFNTNDSTLSGSDYSGNIFGIACVFKY
jgi:hypothetical protein